ncbi:hypothetical protein HDU76_010174, partial [Blyttiomyces sp. JEL0837]
MVKEQIANTRKRLTPGSNTSTAKTTSSSSSRFQPFFQQVLNLFGWVQSYYDHLVPFLVRLRVQRLLLKYSKPTLQLSYKQELHRACHNKDLVKLRKLLNWPLLMSEGQKDLDTYRICLASAVDKYEDSLDLITLLLNASEFQQFKTAAVNHNTVFIQACLFQRPLSMIELLLDHSANPLQLNSLGESALTVSINISQELFTLLLSRVPEDKKPSAFEQILSRLRGEPKVGVAFLGAQGGPYFNASHLILAVRTRRTWSLKVVLESLPFEKATAPWDGTLILHEIVRLADGSNFVVENCNYLDLILDRYKGHKFDFGGASGITSDSPVEWAISTSNFDILATFIKHGADVNQPSAVLKRTPLYFAITRTLNVKMVSYLLKQGADPNLMSFDHQISEMMYPIHAAKSYQLVEMLVAAGAFTDARTEKTKMTALHLACKADRIALESVQVVDLLTGIECDGWQTAQDSTGRTALHCLIELEDASVYQYMKDTIKQMCELLIKRGICWTIKNKNGETAMDVASGA